MKGTDYTVRELINNPSFLRMVSGTAAPDEIEKWNHWIEENDQNRKKAKSASSIIAGFTFKDPDLPDIDKKWSELYAKIVGVQKAGPHIQRKKENVKIWILRVAAVLLLAGMAGLGGGYYFYEKDQVVAELDGVTENKTITVITADNEQKTLKFTTGAGIILNSNSELTYRAEQPAGQSIEVTLEGEAYFVAEDHISQTNPAFAVTTPDGIIRDIGTKFLVTVRHGSTQVVLQEGLVEVKTKGREDTQKQSERFSVNKGEMVEFSPSEILKRKSINPTLHTSWATGYIKFEQTDIHEFAEFVESRFGVKVQVEDLKEGERLTLDGSVYFTTLENLMQSVSVVTGLSAYQSEDRNTIYIAKPVE